LEKKPENERTEDDKRWMEVYLELRGKDEE